MKIKLKYGDSYIKYTTGNIEKYTLANGAEVNNVYTTIDEIYVPENLRYKRIEHKLLNKAVKKIFDEGEMTIKYYVRGLTKDTERFDYLFSILTDFGFHIISKTNDGVMFGFLTKDETDE